MYELGLGAFFFGLLVLGGGVAMIVFHKEIANNFMYGVGSYDKVKMWGLILCGLSIVIMTNFHSFILGFLFKSLFSSGI